MYLDITREVYLTVPVLETTDADGLVIIETLSDLFPSSTYFAMSNRYVVGVAYTGRQVPDLITVAELLGYTVDWGIDAISTIKILGIDEARVTVQAYKAIEAAEALRLAELELVV